MPLDRQQQVRLVHAGAVVLDPDQPQPAARRGQPDAGRAGVDGVLDQLLNHARRPLHHLAGGDLVDERLGQLPDRHGDSPWGWRLAHRACRCRGLRQPANLHPGEATMRHGRAASSPPFEGRVRQGVGVVAGNSEFEWGNNPHPTPTGATLPSRGRERRGRAFVTHPLRRHGRARPGRPARRAARLEVGTRGPWIPRTSRGITVSHKRLCRRHTLAFSPSLPGLSGQSRGPYGDERHSPRCRRPPPSSWPGSTRPANERATGDERWVRGQARVTTETEVAGRGWGLLTAGETTSSPAQAGIQFSFTRGADAKLDSRLRGE